jgi:hypothetical protein
MRLSLLALIAAAACGSDPAPPPAGGCRSGADCAAGQVCLVAAAGQAGTCSAPPFSARLAAPASGTPVGAAGVVATAIVTLAQAGGAAPDAVALVVNGVEIGPMTLQATEGADLRYAGTWVPPAESVGSVVLAAVVTTAGGAIATDGVVLPVDTKKPVLTLPTSSCAPLPGCARDTVVALSVHVDDDHDVTVTATLDLPGATAAATPTGAPQFYGANFSLGSYPFPTFARAVTATFTATDSFGNTATIAGAPFDVTRLRWVYDGQALAVTSPAIAPNGNIVVGVNATSAQLRALKPVDGTELWRATIGGLGIVSAPSVDATSVWAGSNDGKLYGRTLAEGQTLTSCPTAVTGQALFTPVIGGATETVFSAGGAATLYAAEPRNPPTAPAACVGSVTTTDAVTAGAAFSGGKPFVPTVNGVGASTIRRFTVALAADGAVAPTDGPVSCGQINAPLASTGVDILAACANGHVFAVAATTLVSSRVASLTGASLESPVLFPNGDLLVGTNDRKLHRLTPPSGAAGLWVDAWSPVPDLGAAVTGAAIVAADASGVTSYAVTQAGGLFAVAGDGKTVWSAPAGALGAVALSFPSVAPGASGGLPTLYAGSGDGKLYAVVVDSGLDPASPWPKSHHDVRNTGNASAPLP